MHPIFIKGASQLNKRRYPGHPLSFMLYTSHFLNIVVSVVFEDASTNQGLYTLSLKLMRMRVQTRDYIHYL